MPWIHTTQQAFLGSPMCTAVLVVYEMSTNLPLGSLDPYSGSTQLRNGIVHRKHQSTHGGKRSDCGARLDEKPKATCSWVGGGHGTVVRCPVVNYRTKTVPFLQGEICFPAIVSICYRLARPPPPPPSPLPPPLLMMLL